MHRVASEGTYHAKTYSNGDHAVDYYYDQTSYNGLTIANGVGHQTGMSDMTGQTASSFDSEGRVVVENKTINIAGVTSVPVTKQLSYTYNLDGSMASITYPYPDNKTVSYAYNAAGHAVSAIDNTVPASPINYVTAATYAPHGDVAGYVNGQTATFTGITTTNTWNNRFQPTTFTAATQGTGGHTVLSLTFSFNQGTQQAPIDNGLLVKINNGVNSGRNVNYSYDQLNRIAAGWHDASDWGNTYAVDIWGNLYQKNAYTGKTSYDPLTVAINANNRFTGYSYDASGNMTNDQQPTPPGHSYSYDAENRPYAAGGVTYYYDGVGERIAKSNGKLYWFGTGSAPVAESDASGNLTNEYIFFNGKRVAMKRMSDATVHYYFADQIGSANVLTSADGSVTEQDIEYHPYGEQQVYTDTLGQEYRFTGKEHDAETNLDYFGARYYGSAFGRFLTPDWAATPVAIPYAVMGNPQTLNLYSYVENNPITGIDPDGHADGNQPQKADSNPCIGDAECAYQQAIQNSYKKPAPPPPAKKTKTKHASKKGKDKASGAVFYGAKNKRTTLPVGTRVLLTTPGQTSTNAVGTAQREVPYDAAVVTPTGVQATNKPAEIQMQEAATAGTTIAVGCQARCSNKASPDDFNSGRFTDAISVGSGSSFGATQKFYFGDSETPATIVMQLSPGYYALGTSTQVTATADSVTRAIE